MISDYQIPTENIYSVSTLTQEIKLLLETSLPTIWITGEISNFISHSSGHMYFSLKDQNANLPCVMWRGRNRALRFTPENGMKIVAQGKITLYEKRGAYQLDVASMQPAGIGELQLAFEQLKQRLLEEGLFEEEYKKAIPVYPETIGIVTSPTGAAIQDILNILNRRFPGVQVIINPVKVQGDAAAQEIARAIAEFNEYKKIDVMIVGRGGGSIEDLWAFNEEVVARAIFKSEIPIISAVGHEVDFSISDFVSDVRAPTPSAAAELAVQDRLELNMKIGLLLKRLYSDVINKINYNNEKLQNIVNSYGFHKPPDLVKQYQQRLDELTKTLERTQRHHIELLNEKVENLSQKLSVLAPTSILKRGYSICYQADDNTIIKDIDQLSQDDKIKVKLYKGEILGTVDELKIDE